MSLCACLLASMHACRHSCGVASTHAGSTLSMYARPQAGMVAFGLASRHARPQPMMHACHLVSLFCVFLSPAHATHPSPPLPILSSAAPNCCLIVRLPVCLPAGLQSAEPTLASAACTVLALLHSLADRILCESNPAWRHKGRLCHLPYLETLTSALHTAGSACSCLVLHVEQWHAVPGPCHMLPCVIGASCPKSNPG